MAGFLIIQRGDRSAGRTLVAVRRIRPQPGSWQLDLLATAEYDSFCYVTTEALTPWQTHKKYGGRATCETWIGEAKGQIADRQPAAHGKNVGYPPSVSTNSVAAGPAI